MTPLFNLIEKTEDGIVIREMSINSWKIQTVKGRIFDSRELLAASAKLPKSIPFPDMFFGYNSLTVQHNNGFKCSFSALGALSHVGIESDLKVSMSSDWINSRYYLFINIRTSEADHLKIVKPYDWTFTTRYSGDFEWDDLEDMVSVQDMNMDLLKRHDPILFYESQSLYEDELGDNGCSELSVRIRVMPEFFLILQRFFLRIDNVLFRIFDTRILHEWKNNYVMKEISHLEMPYDDALKILRQERLCNQAEGEDLSHLSDSQYISSIMDKQKHEIFFSTQKYNII